MSSAQVVFILAALCLAVGLWLMLPRGLARGWMVGTAFTTVGLGLLVSQTPGLGDWLTNSLFYVLAGITIGSAVATIALPSPAYAAVWFGMTLLGTAGLFLFQGAQFLAVATIIVYAGAILVTFLFVLMLAHPQGRTPYDRMSWEALLSATVGSLLVGILAMMVTSALADRQAVAAAVPVTAAERQAGVLAEAHVAQLGEALFGPHLLAVEVAGTLLLAALIGAVIIVARGRQPTSTPTGSVPDAKDGGRENHG